MELLHNECRNGKDPINPASVDKVSTNSSAGTTTSIVKSGWNTYLDSNTHKGLEILAEHFDLSKKLIVRQLVSEKLRELKLKNPIKEVAI